MVTYHITCSHCQSVFDIEITAKNASILGQNLPCPKCRRHGGAIKPTGRIKDGLFSANLMFGTSSTEG